MFAGTENREFCCGRCKRKEQKRKYYWGEVLGIPISDWPAKDQDDNITKSQGDMSPEPETEAPTPVLGKARQSLGLFAEDMEIQAIQENTKDVSKAKRRKRRNKAKKKLGNSTKAMSRRGSRIRKDSLADHLRCFSDNESDTSSLASDWDAWEEDTVKKNWLWWETQYNCQRCKDHHETHKKWRPKIPRSPNSEKLLAQAETVMRKLLTRKDILNELSLDLQLKKWWAGKLTCKKCKKHHDGDFSGDESTSCSSSHNEREIDNRTAISKPEGGALGIQALPTYNPSNPIGLGGNLGANTLPTSNPGVSIFPTLQIGSNVNENFADTTSKSHVLSPSERSANKWKETNLSLRWWQPETTCKKCTYHHRDLKKLKQVLGETTLDTLLEPLPSQGIHDLINLEDIYLPPGPRLLDLPILESDAKIQATLKPIKTARKLGVKATLPCSLHSRKILEESKQKAIAKASVKQVKDISEWWELDKRCEGEARVSIKQAKDRSCERCSHHHQAHQKRKANKNISPTQMRKGRPRLWERRKDCERCLHHHEISDKLRTTGVSEGVLEWKKEHVEAEEPLLHTWPKGVSSMNSESRPKMMSSTLNELPCDLTVVREVAQDGVTSSTTSKAITSSTTTSVTSRREEQNTGSVPQDLQSKSGLSLMRNQTDTIAKTYLNPIEGVVRRVQDRRKELCNAHEKGNPSRSCPNFVREIGVQTLPVHISEKPRPFTTSESSRIEEKIKNPWPALQAPTPRGELQKLRAKEHDQNKSKSLAENELKRIERIRQLSKEAIDRAIGEALKRPPRIAPTGYRWRESFKNEEVSASDSPKSTKSFHKYEFNVLGKGRDRPTTPPSRTDSNSTSQTPNIQTRDYLRRKKELISHIKPKGPSQHLERRKCKSDHNYKPKPDNKVQYDNTKKLSETSKSIKDDVQNDRDLPKVEEDHASIHLNGDGQIPKLEVPLPQPRDSNDDAPQQRDANDDAPQQRDSNDGAPQQRDSSDSAPQQRDSNDDAPQQRDSSDSAPQQRDSNDSAVQGGILLLPKDAVNIPVEHVHQSKGDKCCMSITKCAKCLENHKTCAQQTNKRPVVHIPKLDLQKVRDAQALDAEEDDRDVETLRSYAGCETLQSYVGCFGPTRRKEDRGRRRWMDPDGEISSGSLSSSNTVDTLESGDSRQEEQHKVANNERREARRLKALAPDGHAQSTGKERGTSDLLETARLKLSFCQ